MLVQDICCLPPSCSGMHSGLPEGVGNSCPAAFLVTWQNVEKAFQEAGVSEHTSVAAGLHFGCPRMLRQLKLLHYQDYYQAMYPNTTCARARLNGCVRFACDNIEGTFEAGWPISALSAIAAALDFICLKALLLLKLLHLIEIRQKEMRTRDRLARQVALRVR